MDEQRHAWSAELSGTCIKIGELYEDEMHARVAFLFAAILIVFDITAPFVLTVAKMAAHSVDCVQVQITKR
jgi:hypothetical protein